MARDGAIYVCQSCGAVHPKWSGQCGACQAWNTLVEETQSRPPGTLKPSRARGLAFEDLRSDNPEPPRLATGVTEFDRVCGGGVVPGSAILLSGDPGVGKSTLLLQVTAHAAQRGARVCEGRWITGANAGILAREQHERSRLDHCVRTGA